VTPIYLIYAEPGNGAVCTPAFGFSPTQPDGKTFLMATPGAQLTAQSINLTGCH
jgi:hypothetical protein